MPLGYLNEPTTVVGRYTTAHLLAPALEITGVRTVHKWYKNDSLIAIYCNSSSSYEKIIVKLLAKNVRMGWWNGSKVRLQLLLIQPNVDDSDSFVKTVDGLIQRFIITLTVKWPSSRKNEGRISRQEFTCPAASSVVIDLGRRLAPSGVSGRIPVRRPMRWHFLFGLGGMWPMRDLGIVGDDANQLHFFLTPIWCNNGGEEVLEKRSQRRGRFLGQRRRQSGLFRPGRVRLVGGFILSHDDDDDVDDDRLLCAEEIDCVWVE